LKRNTPKIYELVFVADMPDEETLKVIEEYGDQYVVNNRLVGMPVAYNQGIARARGRYIALLASDVYVTAQWLPTLLVALKRHPEYGWVAPTWISSDGESGRFSTCSCCLFSREALEEVGVFDEEFSSPDAFGFEDDDLYIRFLLNGYEPHGVLNSYVKHPKSSTTLDAVHGGEKGERFVRNQLRLYRKWGVSGTDWNAVPYTYLEDYQDRFNYVLERATGRILDIGCKESPTFGRREDVVRVDLDAWRHPFFVRADAHRLPFRADVFETAVLGEVLEHVEDPAAVLRESLRVAFKAVFTTPAEDEWLEIDKSHGEEKTAAEALEEQVYPYRSLGLVEVLDEEKHRHHRHRWVWRSSGELEELLRKASNNYTYAKYIYPAYYGGVVYRRTEYGREAWIRDRVEGLLIDIACHTGMVTQQFQGVVGLDLLVDLPMDQQRSVKEAWRGRLFIVGDACNLPLRDKCFDTAVASEVLEHVWTPIALLREAVRVARERVLLTVPDEWNWIPEQKPFTHPQHLHYYTEHTFKDLLGQVGDISEIAEYMNDRPGGFSFFYAMLKPRRETDKIINRGSAMNYMVGR
jgi:ubiquinone/menaquinone biosynthesis C-methylase UbiE